MEPKFEGDSNHYNFPDVYKRQLLHPPQPLLLLLPLRPLTPRAVLR